MTASSFRAKLQELQQIDRICSAEKSFAKVDFERQTLVSASSVTWIPVIAKQEELHVLYNGLLVRKSAVESLSSREPLTSSSFVGRFRSLPKSVTVASTIVHQQTISQPIGAPVRPPILTLADCKRELEELSSITINQPVPTAALRPAQTPKTRPSTALRSAVSRPTSSIREVPTRPCSAKSASILSVLKPAEYLCPRKAIPSSFEFSKNVDDSAALLRKRNEQRSEFQLLKAELERLESGIAVDDLNPGGTFLLDQVDRFGSANTALEVEWASQIDSTFPNSGGFIDSSGSNIVATLFGAPEQCQRDLLELRQQFSTECATIKKLQLSKNEVRNISALVVQRFFRRRIAYPKRRAEAAFSHKQSELAQKEDHAAIIIQRFYRWFRWKRSLSHGNDDVEYV